MNTLAVAPDANRRVRLEKGKDSDAEFYDEVAIPAESFARMVAFTISQPDDVDVNEILFRPTAQEL